MAQVLTMRSCKKTKKSAIRKFKALCHYYNKHSKLIDVVKEMLEKGMWHKGFSSEFATTLESLNLVAESALHVHLDFTDAVDTLKLLLDEAQEERKQTGIPYTPVTAMRVCDMIELHSFLYEMRSEIANILHEVTAILDEINEIENN